MADPPAVKKDLLLEQVGVGQHNHYSNRSLSGQSTGPMDPVLGISLQCAHFYVQGYPDHTTLQMLLMFYLS